MTPFSLPVIRALQSEYEREAERIRLIKLTKVPKRSSPFINKLKQLGKDLGYLVFRLTTRKRKPTRF